MTGRERFLTAINNQKPDRLPCQVHSWMPYYLSTQMQGMDSYAAYEYFGMDPVIYCAPIPIYDEGDLANWQEKDTPLSCEKPNTIRWRTDISTPAGTLWLEREQNLITTWTTRYPIQNEADFEIWNRYIPVPVSLDWTPVLEAKRRVGQNGIVRGGHIDYGQGSPWQSLCTHYDIQQAILDCFDKPDWMHYVLGSLLDKKLKIIERGGACPLDLVETGGGAASSTVISPAMFQEFCLPYDQRQHEALHAAGTKVVYHLCGGMMSMLDLVMQNGADGLETMTPASMGGDCDMHKAHQIAGDRLFFIGGFDQSAGFERGTPEAVRQQVFALHAANPDGGYIISPSDHFFTGERENIQAFVDAVRECAY